MKNLEFEMRLAKYNDITAISEIMTESFKIYAQTSGAGDVDALHETDADIKKDIDNPNKYVFVAFSNGVAVGSVRVAVDMPHKSAYLSRFGVKPNTQNKGIGKSMLSFVDTKMQELGIKQISLHTSATLSDLVCFYYDKGFYVDSTSKERGYIRALMCKDL